MSTPPLFRPNPHVVSTQLDDTESVLLHLKTRRYYSLNDTGSRIWALVEEGLDAHAIAATLTREWDVEAEEAKRHVQAFLDELLKEGILEPRTSDNVASK